MSKNRFLPSSEEHELWVVRQQQQFAHPEQYMLDTLLVFQTIFEDPELHTKSRRIKDLFLQRDFVTLFTDATLLPVYALEHASSRSLCYRDVFMKLKALKVHGTIGMLGAGNGAELLGIAAALFDTQSNIQFVVQDLSNYGILDPLFQAIQERYPHTDTWTMKLDTGDLQDKEYLQQLNWIPGASLITACFVLNELLTLSKKSFVQCIQYLVSRMQKGALLLVIDSAGSFSEVQVGAQDYMLFTLLDHIQQFEIIEKHDSVWYRFPTELRYPLKLNNMRFFLRLYQRK
jgi:25S rRNA (uracil2843-N3)-methyltransferase